MQRIHKHTQCSQPTRQWTKSLSKSRDDASARIETAKPTQRTHFFYLSLWLADWQGLFVYIYRAAPQVLNADITVGLRLAVFLFWSYNFAIGRDLCRVCVFNVAFVRKARVFDVQMEEEEKK